MGTVLPIPPKRIGRRTRLHFTHTHIWMPVVIRKDSDVHIWDRPHIKRILLHSYGHGDHILSMTGARRTYWSLIKEVWISHINGRDQKMHSHDACVTKQKTHGGKQQQYYQEVPGYVPPHVSRLWTIIRYMELFEEQYLSGYVELPQNPNCRIWRIFLVQ